MEASLSASLIRKNANAPQSRAPLNALFCMLLITGCAAASSRANSTVAGFNLVRSATSNIQSKTKPSFRT